MTSMRSPICCLSIHAGLDNDFDTEDCDWAELGSRNVIHFLHVCISDVENERGSKSSLLLHLVGSFLEWHMAE
jgi:hypothetical protein